MVLLEFAADRAAPAWLAVTFVLVIGIDAPAGTRLRGYRDPYLWLWLVLA
jgi:hypothetical protein